jgi:ATP-dependent DNA ligase
LENPGRKAYLHATSINRPDLEYYVMDIFDGFNNRRTQTGTPEDLVERKKELEKILENREFELIEFPRISKTMWEEFDAQ